AVPPSPDNMVASAKPYGVLTGSAVTLTSPSAPRAPQAAAPKARASRHDREVARSIVVIHPVCPPTGPRAIGSASRRRLAPVREQCIAVKVVEEIRVGRARRARSAPVPRLAPLMPDVT